MKVVARLILLVVLALIFTLLAALLRSPIEPEVWTPAPNPGFVDGFELNSGLSGVTLFETPGHGPEDVWCTLEGKWVTGLEDGRIVMLDPDGSFETLGDTGGRPLGLQAMSDGSIIIVDAERGLLRLNSDRSIDVLADEFEGQKIRFADDLDISSDGIVWFSDASQRFGFDEFMLDLLEASRTGRLLSYDLNTGVLQSHIEGLYFANGVALGPGEQFVLVNETPLGRVHRLWLKGARRGETDIFIDNLPAMVDNISFNGSDTFWVASPNPRKSLDALADRPLLRKIAAGLPSWVSEALEEPFSMVSAFDLRGKLITSLRDPTAQLNQITSVNECNGQLLLGSLVSQSIGVVDIVDVR